jgi:peptide/nickel transport system substrate-binding protein
MRRTFQAIIAAAVLASVPAGAQTLRFGTAAGPSALDPHYHNLLANNAALQHVFEPLTWEQPDGAIVGKLASAWRIATPTVWEFTLRQDARFHDGTPFTAADVAFTIARINTVPNSPGPFTTFTRPIAAVEVIDPHTVRFVTAGPYPFIPRDLANLMMLSAKLHDGAATPEFASGARMVGTGPYRFVRYTPGEILELARNDSYRDGRPAWERVILRAIPQDGARVAALLAGDIDIADGVRGADFARVAADPRFRAVRAQGANLVYLFPDSSREVAPFITDRAGQPLSRNPLRDRRVRQALSMAIDRDAFANRLLDGMAVPAHQLFGTATEGRNPALPKIPYDLAAARRLLAEAGYPEGFALTLHGPVGFIADDAQMVQGAAQYFARIGVATRVETLPRAPFFTRASNREFAIFLGSWTGTLGANTIRALLTTYDRERGLGAFNRQRYSNPALDAVFARALSTLDDGARNALMAEVEQIAVEDHALIPLAFTVVTWAYRRDRVADYALSPLARNQAMLATPTR